MNRTPGSNPPDAEAVRFPAGIPFIVGNEGAERFSYYGMRAILYVYLAALYVQFVPDAQLGPDEAAAAKAYATGIAHVFFASVYAFPMIGAILADRLAGKYPVIFWVSLVYCLGHAVLAVAGRFAAWEQYENAQMGMYVGLALIAVASGGIKPCVSANVGDQFTEKNRSLITKVFQIFYFIINFGSFFSTLLTPFLYRAFGPEIAFGVPGLFMAAATLVFWLGRDRFVHVPPNPGGRLGFLDFVSAVLLFTPVIAIILAVSFVGHDFQSPAAEGLSGAEFYSQYVSGYVSFVAAGSWWMFAISLGCVALGLFLFSRRQQQQEDAGFLSVVLHSFRERRNRAPGEGFFAPAAKKYGEEAAEGPPAVLRIMLVFSMVSVFWALFDQHASTWIEQASQMDRSVSVPWWTGHTLIYITVGLALFGGFYLLSWVANVRVAATWTRLALGVALAVVAVAFGLDSVGATLGADVPADGVWSLVLEPAQIQALNPLMVMVIIPLLNVAVYGPLEKRGRAIKPLQKMTLGMFLAAAAFAVAATLQARMEALAAQGEQLHVLWQVGQYLVMTTSEVLVSITGLEFAYTQAPRSMKSTIMGFWLLCVTGGNILVAFLAPIQQILSLSAFFWLFTTLALVASFVFAILAYFYKGKSYMQA